MIRKAHTETDLTKIGNRTLLANSMSVPIADEIVNQMSMLFRNFEPIEKESASSQLLRIQAKRCMQG